MHVNVLLPLAMPAPLTYRLPEGMTAAPGCRVRVPLGLKATYVGIVMESLTAGETEKAQNAGFTIRDVIQVLDTTPVVTPQMMRLWQWVAQYYLCPLGDVLRAALPQDTRKTARSRKATPPPQPAHPSTGTHKAESPLSAPQRQALQDIHTAFATKEICLLHGVTGSGKTEIYTRLIAETLAQGRQVLYLVPEISLTTQLTERLRHIFGPQMAVWHSRLTPATRRDLWLSQAGTAPTPFILGTRSAVFLPWKDIGLIIIDEEHEPSYKQEEPAPRYHARNVALMLARWSNAKTLLGTATPSIETYNMAVNGRYALVTLTQRFNATLPTVEIIDTARLRHQKRMKGLLAPRLLEAMRQTLDSRQQTILFTTRRGYAAQMECPSCGWVPRCQRCHTPLTVHRRGAALACHYCGHLYPVPPQCPSCHGKTLRHRGMGTEKVVEAVQEAFPEARVERMDLDTMQNTDDMMRIIEGMQSHTIDILVGTQMLTKGLDFEGVTLVGVVSADGVLSQPDFRAHERGFHLLSQVAGRAGRRATPGHVIIQTRQADLPILQHVTQADYQSMFALQLAERQLFNFPPYCRIINLVIRHRSEATAQRVAQDIAATLAQYIKSQHTPSPAPPGSATPHTTPPGSATPHTIPPGSATPHAIPLGSTTPSSALISPATPILEFLGPATPLHSRIGGLSAQTIMLKLSPSFNAAPLRALLRTLMQDTTQAQLYCDVDPL